MLEYRIGAVLVNYHSDEQTLALALQFSTYESIEKIVIVNNEANPDFGDTIGSNKIIIINEKENLGYSRGNNIGINILKEEGCKYIVISNSDVDVDEDCIISCVNYVENDRTIGLIAPRMKYPSGKYASLRFIPLNYLRVFLRIFIPEPILDRKTEYKMKANNGLVFQSYVPGSFFIINSEAIKDEYFFDPVIFLYREEEILGARMSQQGYKVAVAVNYEFLHNHIYYDEPYLKRKNRNEIMMKSERVYFKKYLNAKGFKMGYIILMQKIFSNSRYIAWKMKSIFMK